MYRAQQESSGKARHQQLPFTPAIPLGRRLLRQIIASRSIHSQSNSNWMSHNSFKFCLGCTLGVGLSLLIMLLNRVRSISDVRDVNIIFLSCIVGVFVAYTVYKVIKI